MPYEDDYKMWLEKMLIESNPDWVCDGMYDMGFTHEWCEKYCGEDSEYVTPKCLHMYYHHIVKADRKTENSSEKTNNSTTEDCSTAPTISKMEQVEEPQMGDAKPIPLSNRVTHIKDEPQTNKDFKVTYTCSFTDCKNFGFNEKCIECKRKQSEARLEDEPQTDCGDFADRLAYERGVKHAWGVAQKVFDSTLTFYEAEDLAKQIDKDINVRSKDEPQTENLFTDRVGDVWEWRGDAWYCISGDEPQTERSE